MATRVDDDYLAALTRGEVIAPTGYGKGFPVLLPWGLSIARRVISIFTEEFARDSGLLIRSPNILIHAASYDAEVADFGGYSNIYRFSLEGREVVARPDGAVQGLAAAVDALEGDAISTVLSVFQGFRSVKGTTDPLFRDRAIWPFVQLNRLVHREDRSAVPKALRALERFFARLCLPVTMLEMGAWKNYAHQRYDALYVMPDGTPTVLAMFFVVGDTYRRAARVPEDRVALDIGLTEKVIAAMYLRGLENGLVVLPSAVAPVQLVVNTPGGRPRPSTEGVERAEFIEDDSKRWSQRWTRRGVPFLVSESEGRLRSFNALRGWSALDTACGFGELLKSADDSLHRFRTAASLSATHELFPIRCDTCPRPDGVNGTVVPALAGDCRQCGAPGVQRFSVAEHAIY